MKNKSILPIMSLSIAAMVFLACKFEVTIDLTSTPEPALCIDPPAGLISWWPGDGDGNDLLNKNDGNLNNAEFDEGIVGKGFLFDSTNFVNAPTVDFPSGQNDRTLDMWIKADALSNSQSFFAGYGKFGTLGQTYHLGTALKTLFFSQWGDAIFGPDLQTGRWYHVAVTNAGSTVSLYLDGEVVGSRVMKIDTPSETQFFIGGLPEDQSMRLEGMVDEVEIFNRALSKEEILAIYQAGKNGKCKDWGKR